MNRPLVWDDEVRPLLSVGNPNPYMDVMQKAPLQTLGKILWSVYKSLASKRSGVHQRPFLFSEALRVSELRLPSFLSSRK